jgi:hypothetical protein
VTVVYTINKTSADLAAIYLPVQEQVGLGETDQLALRGSFLSLTTKCPDLARKLLRRQIFGEFVMGHFDVGKEADALSKLADNAFHQPTEEGN